MFNIQVDRLTFTVCKHPDTLKSQSNILSSDYTRGNVIKLKHVLLCISPQSGNANHLYTVVIPFPYDVIM